MDIGVTVVGEQRRCIQFYIRGDTVDLEVTVRNMGDSDYVDGGGVEFYYRNGVNKVTIGGTQSLLRPSRPPAPTRTRRVSTRACSPPTLGRPPSELV